eukprot:GHVP01054460.1.p1 GENE.GHVP01054460.1~~GHVP01054460.1.p1  ORF type:complete len:478 (+),score=56.85 GHVP01054460.1:366-1799(+)
MKEVSSNDINAISPIEEEEYDCTKPVHLGTIKISNELTSQSLKEARRRFLLLWLNTMLSLKKIKERNEEEIKYFGPTVLVPKPNKSLRVTHDFSGLKNQTSLFSFNQLKIERIWTWASRQRFMVKLDFIKAFHSVPIDEEDTKFYGFIGPDGRTYTYTVLPMGCKNSPCLFSEFVAKTLNDLVLKYPDNIVFYQDDVAIGAGSPEETTKIAKLASDLLRLAGLIENHDKSFWNTVETKPLLGAIWSPNKVSQKPEAITKLQLLHEDWRRLRTLNSRQKYLGKLASLSNFPGLLAKLAANERAHGPEEASIKILKQLSTTTSDTWEEIPMGVLYVDAADGGTGAVLESADGKTIKTLTNENRLHLPIYELEWVALWKGVTKFLATMKKFNMSTIKILSDNMTVVEAFSKNTTPISATSEYYLNKIRTFLAKESIGFTVKYVPTEANKADLYSRDTSGFSKTKWILWREDQERKRNATK